ncbi:hypothetical protein GCM10022287_28860 [Gryllotalpicola koreensis]|uniref:Uncharacterized protein n=1 Tax=Gryllotalpicola koreensis TaxID=993086 RepID=A0ABP8A5T5_9MICO
MHDGLVQIGSDMLQRANDCVQGSRMSLFLIAALAERIDEDLVFAALGAGGLPDDGGVSERETGMFARAETVDRFAETGKRTRRDGHKGGTAEAGCHRVTLRHGWSSGRSKNCRR